MKTGLRVSQVAKFAGVSIRTLHHYDEMGLVRPTVRSAAGYRLYAPKDLERLQQVLFFKELDFPLNEIQRILSDRDFDVEAALRMQRQLLTERAIRIKALIAAVDAAIDSRQKGNTMTNEERFEVFGDFDPAKYQDEAQEKWGDTDAYKESAKRTQKYNKNDWVKIQEEAESIYQALAELLKRGLAASTKEAMDLAEQHRKHIERWFYPCAPAMHRGLGEMYVNDSRFTDNFERYAPGMAAYVKDAWMFNAERQERRVQGS